MWVELQGPMPLATEAEKAAEGVLWSAGRSAVSEIPRPAHPGSTSLKSAFFHLSDPRFASVALY